MKYFWAEYTGTDPVKDTLSLNLHRRHLSESQRAMIAAKLAELSEEGRNQHASIDAPSQQQAADALSVSRSSVQRAKQVIEKAPELAEQVASGTITVHAAQKAIRLSRPIAGRLFEAIRRCDPSFWFALTLLSAPTYRAGVRLALPNAFRSVISLVTAGPDRVGRTSRCSDDAIESRRYEDSTWPAVCEPVRAFNFAISSMVRILECSGFRIDTLPEKSNEIQQKHQLFQYGYRRRPLEWMMKTPEI
ncbi:MAG TPA: hypothetical protein VIM61_11345 [Chthoniobacterales bacterium]